jgi:thiol-disulfide isomerase/thioredoxin
MSDSARGVLIVGVILFAALIYWLVWVYELPPKDTGGAPTSRGRVGNYLSTSPEIIANRPMRKGEPSPDFSYAAIDGRVIKLSDYRGNKPVVLDFWGTWCRPCTMELPTLQDFYEKHGDQVEIIAITREDRSAAGKVSQMVAEMGITFPIMHDPSGKVSGLFPTRAIPFLVFISVEGNVVDTHTGYDPNIGEEILRTFGL